MNRSTSGRPYLRSTDRDGLKAVLLQGEAGCGKSRLSEWLCCQAGWAGAARPLVVTHSDSQAPGQGLSGMIDYHLRCHGLDSKELSKRLAKLCEAWGVEGDFEPRALTRIVRPNQEEGTLRFNNPQERYAVIRRLLRRITADRPLILVIDDIQWGSDALFFVEELLNLGEDLPVLILLTARTRALRERPFIESRPQRLAEGSDLETLELDPLTENDTRELITELIGLSHDLVQQVAMRSEGNPLFAVQLLSDWVARGVLEASDRGFKLAEGEMGRVPDDVHQLWLQRLIELEKGTGQGSTRAELAAVLGRDVANKEWDRTLPCLRMPRPERLTDRLFKAGLALPTESGWSFCHALFKRVWNVKRKRQDAGSIIIKLPLRYLRSISIPMPPIEPDGWELTFWKLKLILTHNYLFVGSG